MSVSFIAKNLAGDLFHLSYDSSLKGKKQLSSLCSLLYRTFDVSRTLEVVWFVEEEAFKIPAEGQTMEVLFRKPYTIHLSIVDEASHMKVNVLQLTHSSSKPWTHVQVTAWMKRLNYLRASLISGNSVSSHLSDEEWIICEQNSFRQTTCTILQERHVIQPDCMDSLLDLQEETEHGDFQFPDTLHFELTVGSHTFLSPLYLLDGETMDATPVLLAVEEDGMLVRAQE